MLAVSLITVAIHNPDPEFWSANMQKLEQHSRVRELLVSTTKEDFSEILPQADVAVSGRLHVDQIQHCSNLQALFVPFSGVNRFPLRELNSNSVQVYNSHGAARFVAERVLGLLLATTSRIVRSHVALCNGVWERTADSSMFWDSIQGSSVAIVGTGAIGVEIAKFLQVFSCEVFGINTSGHVPTPFTRVETNFATVSDADIVILALPSTQATTGLFGAHDISLLDNAFVVNVGRADVIEENALYAALSEGRIKGYASDVHFQYPSAIGEEALPSTCKLHTLSNVVLTPHTASHTAAARQANVDGAFQQLDRWLEGDATLRPVNAIKGY